MIQLALSFISSLFWAAGKLFEWLYAKQLVDTGKTQQQLEALRNEVTQAQIAIAAREAVRAAVARNPNGLPIDTNDPFLRD